MRDLLLRLIISIVVHDYNTWLIKIRVDLINLLLKLSYIYHMFINYINQSYNYGYFDYIV